MRSPGEVGAFWWNAGWDWAEELKAHGAKLPEDFAPLSGEWAGFSIPEIFGSWEEAEQEASDPFDRSVETAMDALEAGFWASIFSEEEVA
jgi:hypothetical protein